MSSIIECFNPADILLSDIFPAINPPVTASIDSMCNNICLASIGVNNGCIGPPYIAVLR